MLFPATPLFLPRFGKPPLPPASKAKVMFGIGHMELLILLLVLMLLFGSAKLPALMRNLGRSATEFKKGMRDTTDETPDSDKRDSVS